MVNGIVSWFNTEKGYGFVSSDGRDHFIHFKEINMPGFKSLEKGDKVSFVPSKSPKGLTATCLIKVEE